MSEHLFDIDPGKSLADRAKDVGRTAVYAVGALVSIGTAKVASFVMERPTRLTAAPVAEPDPYTDYEV